MVEFSVEFKVAGLPQAHRCLALRVIILVVGEDNVGHELILVDSGGGGVRVLEFWLLRGWRGDTFFVY